MWVCVVLCGQYISLWFYHPALRQTLLSKATLHYTIHLYFYFVQSPRIKPMTLASLAYPVVYVPRQTHYLWWDTVAHWWPGFQGFPAWSPHDLIHFVCPQSGQCCTQSLWLWCRHLRWSLQAEPSSELCMSVNWAKGSAPETAEASWLLLSLCVQIKTGSAPILF